MTLQVVRDRIKSDCVITESVYDSQIDDSIRTALRQLYHNPMWFTRKRVLLTLLINENALALPSDYAVMSVGGLRILDGNIWYAESNGFTQVDQHVLFDDYRIGEVIRKRPVAWAVSGNEVLFNTEADKNYTVELNYHCKDASLPASGSDTSVWFGDGIDAVRGLARALFRRESLEHPDALTDFDVAKSYLGVLIAENNKRN